MNGLWAPLALPHRLPWALFSLLPAHSHHDIIYHERKNPHEKDLAAWDMLCIGIIGLSQEKDGFDSPWGRECDWESKLCTGLNPQGDDG